MPGLVKVTVLDWPAFIKPMFSSVLSVWAGWGSESGWTAELELLMKVTAVPAGTVKSLNLPWQYETVLGDAGGQAEVGLEAVWAELLLVGEVDVFEVLLKLLAK